MSITGPSRRSTAIVATAAASLLALVPVASAERGRAAPPAAPTPDSFRTLDRSAQHAPDATFQRLESKAGTGRVRVIVGLRTDFKAEGALDAAARQAQRADIAARSKGVTTALAGTGAKVVHRYATVPYVALSLTREALDELQQSGRAASIQEDTADFAGLAGSTPLVEGAEAHTLGRNGAGQHIAILDTGVSKTHPFLAGKVVSEACFSANANCPGGVTSSTAVGSGVNCTYAASGCRHGTHVAGIAAGSSATSSGVAPGARLISINVFSRFTGAQCAGAGEDPCTKSFVSDQIKGLDRVFALRSTFRIASVNMSLGGGAFAADCDTDSRKSAIDNLRSVGIATVIASGNDFNNAGVSAPACISTAITVGSTTKADAVSGFSNSSPLVELLAPGSSITSSVPGGGSAPFDGTSMATPHVAGAWAVMRQVGPTATVPAILSHLQSTGKPVTDPDNAVTRPRIRVLTASTRIADTGMRPGAGFILQGGDIASNGVGLATRVGAPATGTIAIPPLPAGAIVQHAALYWMTIGGPDPVATFNGVDRVGTLVGASKDSCWNINQFGANRVYRHVFPLGQVTGAGTYAVGGVGGVGGADGQGASLVILYRVPTSPRTGTLIIRHGAVSGTSSAVPMTNTFTGLTVPTPPAFVRLHAGMADGQAGTEGAMLFNGAAVSPVNFYDGTDGGMWDDDRMVVPTSQLPVGTTTRSNTLTTGSDCLAWAYSALSYQR